MVPSKRRWNTGALVTASWALGGCNLLVGLDDVNIVPGTGGGTAASASNEGGTTATPAGGGGSGGATSTTTSSSGACAQDGDCAPPLVCDLALGTCVPAACNDEKVDGNETGPDCGGDLCPPCADGLGCEAATDCVSAVCDVVCLAPTCSDGATNATETDVDCGGACAEKCGDHAGCATDADCKSNLCAGGGLDKQCAVAACGDGVLNGGEGCDDGGAVSGDGCSSACAVEPGYSCSGTKPSVCVTVCGDAIINGVEQCDDGNKTAGDGCSAGCKVEPYHQCSTPGPSVCTKQETRCSDAEDNDGDLMVDASDDDCALPMYALPPPCGALRIYRSVNVPKSIPDENSDGAWSTIFVPDEAQITHMAILLNLTHPRDSDINVTLYPPFGNPRNVTSGNGGTGANYTDAVFDSACATSVTAGSAPFQECFRPEGWLPNSGQPIKGAWSLKVEDVANGETGTLDGWSLLVCTQ
jgi:cysteine-rich repeat protein